MARRAALSDISKVIEIIEEDGGVILEGFASYEEVKMVNDDTAPYLKAVIDDVSTQVLMKASYAPTQFFRKTNVTAPTASL
jgi:hypothetical protein